MHEVRSGIFGIIQDAMELRENILFQIRFTLHIPHLLKTNLTVQLVRTLSVGYSGLKDYVVVTSIQLIMHVKMRHNSKVHCLDQECCKMLTVPRLVGNNQGTEVITIHLGGDGLLGGGQPIHKEATVGSKQSKVDA